MQHDFKFRQPRRAVNSNMWTASSRRQSEVTRNPEIKKSVQHSAPPRRHGNLDDPHYLQAWFWIRFPVRSDSRCSINLIVENQTRKPVDILSLRIWVTTIKSVQSPNLWKKHCMNHFLIHKCIDEASTCTLATCWIVQAIEVAALGLYLQMTSKDGRRHRCIST